VGKRENEPVFAGRGGRGIFHLDKRGEEGKIYIERIPTNLFMDNAVTGERERKHVL